MNDKTLLKFALGWSLVGIVALMVISEYSEPETVKIIELGEHLGKAVYIQGNVSKATYSEKVTILDIDDGTSDVTVAAFEKMNKTIGEGDVVRIYGKVKLYKSELEIIADKIECISCG